MDDRGRLRAASLLARLGRVSHAELERFQRAQLRRIVAHAYQRVPYYRRLYEEHRVSPTDVHAPEGLSGLPSTRRTAIQDLPPGDVLETDVDTGRLVAVKTAGTSSRPLTLYRSRGEERIRSLVRQRALFDLGVRPWDRQVSVALGRRAYNPRRPHVPQRVLRGLGLFRRQPLNFEAGSPAVVDALSRIRPDVILGYPSVLAQVARACGEAGIARMGARLAVCGAEVLTPLVRAQLQDTLAAQVRDWYGCNEVGLVAWECAQTHLFHIAAHTVILEVERDDGRPAGAGETGEAIVTSLHSFAMPFIRYRIGDLVTRGPESCPCGAPFATLAAIDGRTWESATLANGRVVHAVKLNRVVQAFARSWVRQFQLVQERADAVALVVVPSSAPSDADLAEAHRAMAEFLGPGIALEVRLAREIAGEPRGKFRQVRALAT